MIVRIYIEVSMSDYSRNCSHYSGAVSSDELIMIAKDDSDFGFLKPEKKNKKHYPNRIHGFGFNKALQLPSDAVGSG